jgi:hypothetical protein
LKAEFLDALSPAARRDTALFITGDHGQVLASQDRYINIDQDKQLKEHLFMRPAGEPRTPYLYAKQGKKKELLSYLQENLSHALVAWDSAELLGSGILGPEPIAAKVEERLGDVVATMRENYLLLTGKEVAKMAKSKGSHGGMTATEMEVPWLGFHLDS